jgi:arabinogalactan endo-1,4-beta-galactosidase
VRETIKNVGINFERDNGKKKDVKKILKNSSLNSAATCSFFFNSFNKIYILHFF